VLLLQPRKMMKRQKHQQCLLVCLGNQKSLILVTINQKLSLVILFLKVHHSLARQVMIKKKPSKKVVYSVQKRKKLIAVLFLVAIRRNHKQVLHCLEVIRRKTHQLLALYSVEMPKKIKVNLLAHYLVVIAVSLQQALIVFLEVLKQNQNLLHHYSVMPMLLRKRNLLKGLFGDSSKPTPSDQTPATGLFGQPA